MRRTGRPSRRISTNLRSVSSFPLPFASVTDRNPRRMTEEIAALRRGENVPVQSYFPPAPHEASPPPGSRHSSPHAADASHDDAFSPPRPPPPKPKVQRQRPQQLIPEHPLAPIVSSELSLLREREERERLMQALSGGGAGPSMSRGYANSRDGGEMAIPGMGLGQAKMPVSMERGQTPASRDGSTGAPSAYRNAQEGYEPRGSLGALLDRGDRNLYALPPVAANAQYSQERQQQQGMVVPKMESNPSPMEDISFDFDAPFDFSFADSIPLPPLFQDIFDSSYQHNTTSSGAPTNGTNSHLPSPNPTAAPPTSNSAGRMESEDVDVDLCPIDTPEDFADPPPLPNGRLPCDKPECDFSIISCALPLPWRPSAIGGDVPSNSVWTAPVSWAKLCSHPMFGACDVVRPHSSFLLPP